LRVPSRTYTASAIKHRFNTRKEYTARPRPGIFRAQKGANNRREAIRRSMAENLFTSANLCWRKKMNTPKDHDKFAASAAHKRLQAHIDAGIETTGLFALLALVAGGSAIFAALFLIHYFVTALS
jgi:hypothetical protein